MKVNLSRRELSHIVVSLADFSRRIASGEVYAMNPKIRGIVSTEMLDLVNKLSRILNMLRSVK